MLPMADIFCGLSGGPSPNGSESRVISLLEQLISNIKGVEYVYSTSMKEQGIGDRAVFVAKNWAFFSWKLFTNEINKHYGPNASRCYVSIIKTRAIDDVPILGLTLWSEITTITVNQIAQELEARLKKVNDVAITINLCRTVSYRVVLD